jgi:hypothetical protein
MKIISSLIFLLSFLTIYVKAQEIQNPGFEKWENAGTVADEPVDWSSLKTTDALPAINNAAPMVWAKSTSAHSGSYSIQLTNIEAFSIVANGIVTNGRIHASFTVSDSYIYTDPADEKWHTSFTSRPGKFAIWAKYTPKGTDTAQIKVLLHKGTGSLPPKPDNRANQVGFAQINIYGTVSTWTRFEMPFEYYSQENPEFILIIASSGSGSVPVAGSVVLLDDLELVYYPAGIDNMTTDKNLIYTSGNTIFLDKLPEPDLRNAKIEILSLNGSVIYSAPVSSLSVEVGNAKTINGLYIVRVYGREVNYTQKIYLK